MSNVTTLDSGDIQYHVTVWAYENAVFLLVMRQCDMIIFDVDPLTESYFCIINLRHY